MYKKLKRLLIFFTILIISFIFLAINGDAAEIKVRVIAHEAIIRLKPDINSPVISIAPIGSVLESEGKEGEWYRVNLPPDKSGTIVFGYIHESEVEIVEEIKAVPKEEKEIIEKRETRIEQPSQVPKEKIEKIPKKAKIKAAKKRNYKVKVGMNYFIPSEKAFRDIYGGGMIYMGEMNIRIWRNIELWIGGSDWR